MQEDDSLQESQFSCVCIDELTGNNYTMDLLEMLPRLIK